jgi:hypothetical protein
VAGSYAIEAPVRAGGLAGGCNAVQAGVSAGDVVAAGAVALALGTGAEVHPPDAAMHTIAASARTAREHSNREPGSERHRLTGV